MKRLLLVSALLCGAALAGPAHADPSICTIRGCVTEIGEAVCGQYGCGPVARCHYWTDYPICLY
jgi:hypothetical protein